MIIPASARMTTIIVGGSVPAGGGEGCTIGNEDIEATEMQVSPGNLFGCRWQAPCSGTIASISFAFSGTYTSDTALAIYSDDAGAVNAVLGYSDQHAVGSGGTWIEHTGGTLSGISITSGNYYWIVIWADDDGTGSKVYHDNSGTHNGHAWYNYETTYSTSWPAGSNFGVDDTGHEFSFKAVIE